MSTIHLEQMPNKLLQHPPVFKNILVRLCFFSLSRFRAVTMNISTKRSSKIKAL